MADINKNTRPLSYIYESLDAILNEILLDGSTNLFDELKPFFILLTVAWFAVYGYSILFGWIEVSVKRQSRDVLMFLILNFMFFQYDTYLSSAKELFIDQPTIVAGIVTGTKATAGGPFASLDSLVSSAVDYLWKAIDRKGIFESFGPVFLALILCGFVMYLCLNTLYIVSKCTFFIMILLIATPIPIIFAVFPETRKFALAWLVQIISFSFLMFFVTLLIGVIVLIGGESIDSIKTSTTGEGEGLTSVDMILIVMITYVGAKSILEVNTLAQAISGGVGVKMDMGSISKADIPNPMDLFKKGEIDQK